MDRKPLRVFGLEFGRAQERPLNEGFERLADLADQPGVQWRDLVEDGYCVPGDLFMGCGLVRYNWKWRIAELQRRLDQSS